MKRNSINIKKEEEVKGIKGRAVAAEIIAA